MFVLLLRSQSTGQGRRPCPEVLRLACDHTSGVKHKATPPPQEIKSSNPYAHNYKPVQVWILALKTLSVAL